MFSLTQIYPIEPLVGLPGDLRSKCASIHGVFLFLSLTLYLTWIHATESGMPPKTCLIKHYFHLYQTANFRFVPHEFYFINCGSAVHVQPKPVGGLLIICFCYLRYLPICVCAQKWVEKNKFYHNSNKSRVEVQE